MKLQNINAKIVKNKPVLFTLAAIVIALAIAFVFLRGRGANESSPNVIVVLVDTLRADHLGYEGYELPTSPQIDAFAKENSTLEPFYSVAPWTSPAIASLFTGLYPSSHGVLSHAALSKDQYPQLYSLSDSVVTMAECFRSFGYQTGAVSSNPWVLEEFGFKQGFEHFAVLGNKSPAEKINEAAFKWIEKRGKAKPFFLYLHYMDCHGPYIPPAPYKDMFLSTKPVEEQQVIPAEIIPKYLGVIRDSTITVEFFVSQYNGAIRYFDDHFGELIQFLKDRNIYDNSVIVFVADHGEEFMEHGSIDHGWTLYQEQLNIPFILKLPNGQKVNWDLRGRVPEIIDVYPTVVAAAGLKAKAKMSGRNLLVSGEPEQAFAEADKRFKYSSLIGEEYQYIRCFKTKRANLFNLAKDPSEQRDLLESKDGTVDVKWDDALFQRIEDIKPLAAKPDLVNVRTEVLDNISTLGYLGGVTRRSVPVESASLPTAPGPRVSTPASSVGTEGHATAITPSQ